jgi:DNA-binding CsgD family transcriptional regulator/putative methionine-R-sulfoxide reductase with GAF domain
MMARMIHSWEAELERVSSAFSVISKPHRSLCQVEDFVTWLNHVCHTLVEVGACRMAVIGFAEQDEQKTIRTVANAGHVDGYFDEIALTWADVPRGRGPSGTTIRTGRAQICRNIHDDPAFRPWRKQAIERGYQSSVSLPLAVGGQTFGVLGLYSDVINAFCPRKVEAIRGLADNLALGLTVVLGARAERHQAIEAVRESHRALEAKNIAMREVLASIESQRGRMGRQINANLERLVLPLLRSLRQGLNHGQQRCVDQIERMLDDVTSPFIDSVCRAANNLTPMELRICDLIKQGLAVKEIAELEHLSPHTIAVHRRNIRRKLGIVNQQINLTSHLRTVSVDAPSSKG